MLSPKGTVGSIDPFYVVCSNCSTGDTAVALLKAGAETDKKDAEGHLALDLAPDAQVGYLPPSYPRELSELNVFIGPQVHLAKC